MTLLLLGLLLAFLHFLIQETLAIPASQEKLALSEEATGIRNLNDNRDVTLQAPDGTYVMYARRYLEETRRITNVTVLKLDAAGRLRERIVAASGTFNGTYWELKDVIRSISRERSWFPSALRRSTMNRSRWRASCSGM